MALATRFTYGPTNVDALLTTTRSVISEAREFLNDAIFNRITLLKWLQEKAQVTKQGGASILMPLLYARANGFAAYSADDVISVTGSEGLTNAQYPWRNYAGPITLYG